MNQIVVWQTQITPGLHSRWDGGESQNGSRLGDVGLIGIR